MTLLSCRNSSSLPIVIARLIGGQSTITRRWVRATNLIQSSSSVSMMSLLKLGLLNRTGLLIILTDPVMNWNVQAVMDDIYVTSTKTASWDGFKSVWAWRVTWTADDGGHNVLNFKNWSQRWRNRRNHENLHRWSFQLVTRFLIPLSDSDIWPWWLKEANLYALNIINVLPELHHVVFGIIGVKQSTDAGFPHWMIGQLSLARLKASMYQRQRLKKTCIVRHLDLKLKAGHNARSFGTIPGPTLGKYWSGNRAIWLVDFIVIGPRTALVV